MNLDNTIIGGCYRLLRPLGVGGMGTVYEAQHLRLGGRVAVKILSPQLAGEPKFRERFRREARAASQIRHPNVVQLMDFGETPNNSVFIAMELLEGRDLHHILRRHAPAPFPWVRARNLLAQAADALAAAHRCGIVHRDVKPSNIFVLEGPGVDDFVKLLDFGIAKIVAAAPTADSAFVKNLTGTGEIFGTAKYMAPEQAYGTSDDPRVDVYSLGIVAYELLTGRVPFTGESNFEIVTRHVYDEPRPPRQLRPELPAALEAIVLRALEKQPERRFEAMEHFGQALRGVADVTRTPGRPSTARASSLTDADTLLCHIASSEPSIRPTVVQQRVQAPISAIAPAAAPAFAPVVGPAATSAVVPHVGAAKPELPAVLHAAPAHGGSATQRMTDLRRAEGPTGPLARRHDSVLDDTAREIAMVRAVGPGTWRILALAVTGAMVVGSLAAVGAIFVAGSGTEVPVPTQDQPAHAPTLEAMRAALFDVTEGSKPVSPESAPTRVDRADAETARITDADEPAGSLDDLPGSTVEPPAPDAPSALDAPSSKSEARRRSASQRAKQKRKTTFDPFD